MAADYWVRTMGADDVADVERLTDAAYRDHDLRLRRVGDPEPAGRTPQRARAWRERAAHLVRHDPRGCWVAEGGDGLLGAALSLRRELTWVLAAYAVRPAVQGRGVGRRVLEPALAYGAGALRGMLAASDDPRALRHYRMAGFDLHPTMQLRGRVARAALPVVDRVREGSLGDVDLMDSVDRRTRGAAHGPDHALLVDHHRLVVADRPTGSGYAFADASGAPVLLAATSRRVASDLLWECLAGSDPGVAVAVRHLTPANGWALDVGTAARLELSTSGYLALRGLRPPAPYLPHGQLL